MIIRHTDFAIEQNHSHLMRNLNIHFTFEINRRTCIKQTFINLHHGVHVEPHFCVCETISTIQTTTKTLDQANRKPTHRHKIVDAMLPIVRPMDQIVPLDRQFAHLAQNAFGQFARLLVCSDGARAGTCRHRDREIHNTKNRKQLVCKTTDMSASLVWNA